jgi:hypothetical protein
MTTARPIVVLAFLATFMFGLAAIEHEFQFGNGTSWRGADGEEVTVVFTENGVEQVVTGNVVKVDGKSPYRLVAVRGEIAGRVATKAIFESDIISMSSTGSEAVITEAPREVEQGDMEPKAGKVEASMPTTRGNDGFLQSPQPGVFFLPWEGQVGTLARHESIEAIAREADKYGPGQTIVLHINSPGGLVLEGDEIHDTLMELKQRHRVVAWIKKAISAGAFTALHCDEIYFETVGAMGSAVMYAGTKSADGAQLAAWVKDFGDVAEAGGRSRIPAECMITRTKMASYDKDPETGKVTWYPDMRGEHNISNQEQVLTLNAGPALHSNYIDGIANTEEELAALLDLEEWYEITDRGRKIHENWHRLCERCERDVRRINRDLGLRPERRIALLEELLAWWDRCEPMMMWDLGRPGGSKDELRRAIERERRARARQRDRN